jgi:hypothetical protein
VRDLREPDFRLAQSFERDAHPKLEAVSVERVSRLPLERPAQVIG